MHVDDVNEMASELQGDASFGKVTSRLLNTQTYLILMFHKTPGKTTSL